MNLELKSDIHYFFLKLGYHYISPNQYEKDNVLIEFEDFYNQIFKYYVNNKLLYVTKDNNLNLKDIKNILRDINLDSILE